MIRVSGAVADRIEARYPHAAGMGPAGEEAAWALVRGGMWDGKHWIMVYTMGSKYRHQRKRPMIHSGRGISKGPWTPPEQTNAALGKDK